jgi:hypothetical protein
MGRNRFTKAEVFAYVDGRCIAKHLVDQALRRNITLVQVKSEYRMDFPDVEFRIEFVGGNSSRCASNNRRG